jgi:protoporphyrinogen oxidase
MWELVADKITAAGGEILTGWKVTEACTDPDNPSRLRSIVATNRAGETREWSGDLFFSTMPVQDLVRSMRESTAVPEEVVAISEGLLYRDFITVGVLLDELLVHEVVDGQERHITDNWLYIQDAEVQVGRIQVFNNWSPYLVADPSKSWIGLEYFCDEGDALWSLSDEEMSALGVRELAQIGLAQPSAVRDSVVIRMPKTYPAYFGTYGRFDELRAWLDGFENLYLLGRNGMHRYNNQDHSMLTAMVSVDNLVDGRVDKDNIWNVNTEQEYHESRKT